LSRCVAGEAARRPKDLWMARGVEIVDEEHVVLDHGGTSSVRGVAHVVVLHGHGAAAGAVVLGLVHAWCDLDVRVGNPCSCRSCFSLNCVMFVAGTALEEGSHL